MIERIATETGLFHMHWHKPALCVQCYTCILCTLGGICIAFDSIRVELSWVESSRFDSCLYMHYVRERIITHIFLYICINITISPDWSLKAANVVTLGRQKPNWSAKYNKKRPITRNPYTNMVYVNCSCVYKTHRTYDKMRLSWKYRQTLQFTLTHINRRSKIGKQGV